jgi:hypothetical protein
VPGAALARYVRHRPETTTLYQVVRENLDTLYAAVDDGALSIALPPSCAGSSTATWIAVLYAVASRRLAGLRR